MPSTSNSVAPPPPPPQPISGKIHALSRVGNPPVLPSNEPAGAFLVELLIYNGAPFKDHWAYYVGSHDESEIGVKIQATGDVRNGFRFEIKRSENLRTSEDIPTRRVPLQWVDKKHFDEKAMLNNGEYKVDDTPICRFEESAYKIKAPEKSLNVVDNNVRFLTRSSSRRTSN